MKIILLQNIKGFGQMGDVKNISDGYARNFLLPRRMAKAATEGSLKEVETLKKKVEIVLKEEREQIKKAAEKLKDGNIELSGKVSSGGKLFASINKRDIVKAIQAAYGIVLEESMLKLDEGEHIKMIGEHTITLKLDNELSVPFKVTIKEA